MPPKTSKICKNVKPEGGWFWERNDPTFGASNRWIGDKVIQPLDNDLKETKLSSKIAGPVGGLFGGPAGAIVGNLASAGLTKAGYGCKPCRPSGKCPQHGLEEEEISVSPGRDRRDGIYDVAFADTV